MVGVKAERPLGFGTQRLLGENLLVELKPEERNGQIN